MPRFRRAISATLCAAGALTATAMTAPSAVAADQVAAPCGNVAVNGSLCYRWGPNNTGASAGFSFNVPDLLTPTRWLFRPDGQGQGQRVANNAASAHNRNATKCALVYYNQNYGEPSVWLWPDGINNSLGVVTNNNRSHEIFLCD